MRKRYLLITLLFFTTNAARPTAIDSAVTTSGPIVATLSSAAALYCYYKERMLLKELGLLLIKDDRDILEKKISQFSTAKWVLCGAALASTIATIICNMRINQEEVARQNLEREIEDALILAETESIMTKKMTLGENIKTEIVALKARILTPEILGNRLRKNRHSMKKLQHISKHPEKQFLHKKIVVKQKDRCHRFIKTNKNKIKNRKKRLGKKNKKLKQRLEDLKEKINLYQLIKPETGYENLFAKFDARIDHFLNSEEALFRERLNRNN
ncbi:hypothetical protein KKA53_00180 [Candidatus Dependentiae bacterium]|nr:hypothetical protein [Candidatus Dependentiae bacterium]